MGAGLARLGGGCPIEFGRFYLATRPAPMHPTCAPFSAQALRLGALDVACLRLRRP
jgi:hypothetical protein